MAPYKDQIDALSRVLREPVDAGTLARLEQGICEYAGLRKGTAMCGGYGLFAATTWRQFVSYWHGCFTSTGTDALLTYLPEGPGHYTSEADKKTIEEILKEINAMRTHLLEEAKRKQPLAEAGAA